MTEFQQTAPIGAESTQRVANNVNIVDTMTYADALRKLWCWVCLDLCADGNAYVPRHDMYKCSAASNHGAFLHIRWLSLSVLANVHKGSNPTCERGFKVLDGRGGVWFSWWTWVVELVAVKNFFPSLSHSL